MIPFITAEEYATWSTCSMSDLPSDIDRIILRATELLFYKMFMSFTLPELTADVPVTVKDATCAQVEFWLEEVGEGYDRMYDGPVGNITLKGQVMAKMPGPVAPRAIRILRFGGYLNRMAQATGYGPIDSDV